jgi:hypothetical protein
MCPLQKFENFAALSLIQTHSKKFILRAQTSVITFKIDVDTLKGPLNVSTFILSVFTLELYQTFKQHM